MVIHALQRDGIWSIAEGIVSLAHTIQGRLSRWLLDVLTLLPEYHPSIDFACCTMPPHASAPVRQVDATVSGGVVVTMDAQRRVIADGAVAISAHEIVAVDRRDIIEAAFIADQRIDAQGRTVIPGLINGHAHLPMTLFRGLADDQDLDDWLQHTIFPAEAMNVDETFVRCGSRLGLAELIRGGITTVCAMYYYEMAVAEELATAGTWTPSTSCRSAASTQRLSTPRKPMMDAI